MASILKCHCPEYCKVVLTAMDLLCFNLSVLAEYAYGVYLYNIVGVTGHYGMETLPAISRVSAYKWRYWCPVSDRLTSRSRNSPGQTGLNFPSNSKPVWFSEIRQIKPIQICG